MGDVKFNEVQHAKAVTPVPGGVGPMTIACLLANTVKAARNRLVTGPLTLPDDYADAPGRSMYKAD